MLGIIWLGLILSVTPIESMSLEAPIIPGATALRESGRYLSPRTYEETLDFYRRIFNGANMVRWRNVVNTPTVRAKHVESLRKKTRWEGINIYEIKGKVGIYILPR